MALNKNLTFLLLGEDRSASSTMTHTQEVAEKTASRIGGTFSKLGGQLGGEFGEVLNRVGEGIEDVGSHTKNAAVFMGAAGGVAAGLGVALQQAGSADKQAADQLKQSIEAGGHSYESYREEIEKTISTQENYGHGAVDTQQALQKMTTAFNDPKKALEQMGLVANLAAARHISLSDAAQLVVKVTEGKGTRVLTDYGITMGKSKDKTHDAQVALEELSKKVDGQASASMNNFGSQVGVVRTKLGDWIAQIGNQFGPGITIAGTALMGASAAMEIFRVANVGAKIATIASAAATGIATAAQWAWNVALDANPIGIVIIAITALVAGLVWFFTQTKLGKEVWHNVTQFIGQAVTWLWTSVLKPTFGFIGAIFTWLYQNIILPYVNLIVLEFKVLGAIALWLYQNAVAPAANWIVGAVHTIGSVIGTVFGAIGSVIRGAFDGVVGFVRGIFNGIIDAVNGVIGGINTIGSAASAVGLGGFHLSTLHHLALGGIVTKPTYAQLGESGPEAVIPLNSGIPGALRGGGGDTYNITIHAGAVGSEDQLARAVISAIVNSKGRGTSSMHELRTALGV